ncbi:MAG TPA: DUF3168 domain-containing protein [Allosphingosinicella sp.]|jgi:hypothetical protein|nr:DUF3168 domain-containing protein [Allosphingosinicella sp.]
MTGAGEALAEAAMAALNAVEGLNGAYDGPPLTAAFPYARIEAGPESDWSHKSGAGRELRLAIILHDQGERPARLRALMGAAEAAAGAIGPGLDGWRLVNLVFLRNSLLRDKGAAWAAAIEFRARLLKT